MTNICVVFDFMEKSQSLADNHKIMDLRDFSTPLCSAQNDKHLCHFDLVEKSLLFTLYLSSMKKTIGTHNYHVYIITNKIKIVLYIGFTNNLRDRLYYHSNPEANSKHFSHKYKCKFLIYFEHYQSVETAIDREKQLKRWNRKKKEFLIATKNPNWNFLNDEV